VEVVVATVVAREAQGPTQLTVHPEAQLTFSVPLVAVVVEREKMCPGRTAVLAALAAAVEGI
jgi:hypothetical protein